MNSLCITRDRNSKDSRDINLGEAKGPLAASPTHLAFPSLPSTMHDFHMDGATNNEEYSNREVTQILRIQPAIIDSLCNARDINPGKPCETARRPWLPDLPLNDDEDYWDTPYYLTSQPEMQDPP